MAIHRQKKKFVLPTKEERAQALGEIDNSDKDIRRALTIAIDECFPSIPILNEDECLSEHYDAGQTRINQYTKQSQYFVSNIMNQLKKMQRKRHKREELFSTGVTVVDIYPNPQWNFVYGKASINEGIAIYSIARFDPLFPHTSIESYSNEEQVLILRRAVSTYVHEVMHLLFMFNEWN
ncbi:unnamed protein product [Adineta steineri]|uniref:Uncharacterized protein n=1 Tax=Adineta steineri TaxID=433720 RepID=A0A814IH23_9BILA|nr:unnamed protein product [Adineta steineri]CAF1044242.1 unnamed protein product [Adineta steineri]